MKTIIQWTRSTMLKVVGFLKNKLKIVKLEANSKIGREERKHRLPG